MKTKTWILFLGLLIGAPPLLKGQIKYEVSFKTSDLQITSSNEGLFNKIEFVGTRYSDEQGAPELPIRCIKIILPPGTIASRITYSSSAKQKIKLGKKIMPIQPEEILSLNDEVHPVKKFINPDDKIYNNDKPYPSEIVQIIDQGTFRGIYKIVTIAVYPVQYYPKNDYIEFNELIDFEVGYKNDSIVSDNISIKNDADDIRILKSMVKNRDDIDKFYTTINKDNKYSVKSVSSYSKGDFNVAFRASVNDILDYVIITTPELAPAFDEFMAWKRRKGYRIGVVTTTDIYAAYPNGDLVSGINDNPGKIRQYLISAFSNGLKYLLLGGVNTLVPVRYAAGSQNIWTFIEENDYKVPSDVYFSELDGDWNVDGADPDGIVRYGEPYDDDVQYEPEIYVGRLLCRNRTDIENWTNKILKYEQNPGNGDRSYLTRSLMVQIDEMQRDDNAGIVADSLSGFRHTILEEKPGWDYPGIPTETKGAGSFYEL